MYEVYALRYATTAPDRPRRENFLPGNDLHDGPMPMDYYIWVIRDDSRVIVVDTGFGPEQAEQRDRILLRTPVELLAKIGIAAAEVENVILTHLHYDHAGRLQDYPAATFHLQEAEMAFATGKHMCVHCHAHPFHVEDVVDAVRLVYAGRLQFHCGESVLCEGVSLHVIGGHTSGLQAVRVMTARGPLVLASDGFHFIENRQRRAPFPIVFDQPQMLAGYAICESLSGHDETLLVPGHDPAVRDLWPRAFADDEDIIRLDLGWRSTAKL